MSRAEHSRATLVDGGGYRFYVPHDWPEVTAFGGLFTASAEAVAAVLPSPGMHLVPGPRGEAVVWVACTRMPVFAARREGDMVALAPPVVGCLVAVLVTRDRRPRRWSAMTLGRPGSGVDLLELAFPISSGMGAASGRAVWGEPKFVADFDVTIRADGGSEATVTEGGRALWTLSTQRTGTPRAFSGESLLLCAADGRLRGLPYANRGWRWITMRPARARFTLGDHPLAQRLRELGIADTATMTTVMRGSIDEQGVPTDLGEAGGTLPWYVGGTTARHGRYVLHLPHAGAVDLYAGVTDEVWETGFVPANPPAASPTAPPDTGPSPTDANRPSGDL